jgi:hypothetical protein
MTTEAPRRAALDTTEILENILSYLPNRTVFGVQRVCRQWRDAIAVSPTIQDKLFLRLRGQTPETWLLTNPEEKKFRVAAPADIEFPSEVNFGQRPLFMPVTLNPLLEWWDEAGLWIEENSVQHYACVARGSNFIRFAQHSSARATFITDPPSKECQVGLDFEPRPMRPEFRFMGSCANVKSDQPLALGQAIGRALQSTLLWVLDEKWKKVAIHATRDTTVANKIIELEKLHDCKVVLVGVHIGLALDETKIRRLALTDAEYHRYRPKGDEVIE